MTNNLLTKTTKFQGALGLSSLVLFLLGVITGTTILIIVGGILLALDDAVQMINGTLRPEFPILFALILAYFITPWWLGVFWSIAIFEIINIPTNFKKLFKTKKFIKGEELKLSFLNNNKD